MQTQVIVFNNLVKFLSIPLWENWNQGAMPRTITSYVYKSCHKSDSLGQPPLKQTLVEGLLLQTVRGRACVFFLRSSMLTETCRGLGQLCKDLGWWMTILTSREHSWAGHTRVLQHSLLVSTFSEHCFQFLAPTNTWLWSENVTSLIAPLHGGPHRPQENGIVSWKCAVQLL